ncbi:MAG TPA: hypothetical protein VKG43_04125 [Acidimicrobiales bacterium]|nr:hypothetical protein [Acidimicrobiales bacterium]
MNRWDRALLAVAVVLAAGAGAVTLAAGPGHRGGRPGPPDPATTVVSRGRPVTV